MRVACAVICPQSSSSSARACTCSAHGTMQPAFTDKTATKPSRNPVDPNLTPAQFRLQLKFDSSFTSSTTRQARERGRSCCAAARPRHLPPPLHLSNFDSNRSGIGRSMHWRETASRYTLSNPDPSSTNFDKISTPTKLRSMTWRRTLWQLWRISRP